MGRLTCLDAAGGARLHGWVFFFRRHRLRLRRLGHGVQLEEFEPSRAAVDNLLREHVGRDDDTFGLLAAGDADADEGPGGGD